MNKLVHIAKGQPYPWPISSIDGAAAHFLGKHGNFLQIGMNGLLASEVKSIRFDPMKAGFIHDGPLILWLFQFGTIILECPFDARLIPGDAIDIPVISTANTRLSLDIHLVDLRTNVVRALRQVTLTSSLTARFCSAARQQLGTSGSIDPVLTRYSALSLENLVQTSSVELCGR